MICVCPSSHKFCRHGRCGQSEGHGHTKNGEKESLTSKIAIGQMIRKQGRSVKQGQKQSKAKQGTPYTTHKIPPNERTPTLPLMDKSIAAYSAAEKVLNIYYIQYLKNQAFIYTGQRKKKGKGNLEEES